MKERNGNGICIGEKVQVFYLHGSNHCYIDVEGGS
jgi:hypothetical protein